MADEAPMNRRRYPRAGPVIIRCEFSYRASAAEGYLVSLSEAGAFLSTDERIAVGERLVLRVSLPWQMGEIHAEAEVISFILKALAQLRLLQRIDVVRRPTGEASVWYLAPRH
jgi:hypothetical protein